MWVRGLKLHFCGIGDEFLQSHPMWVRGLKHFRNFLKIKHSVAPHVGAWIETQ